MKPLGKQSLTVMVVGWLTAASVEAATVAYWRFETDNGTGVANGQTITRADDSSGNGAHLYPVSGISTYTANSGVFTNYLGQTFQSNNFYASMSDGTQALTNGNFTALNGDTTFTIEGFFRKTAGDGGGPRALFDLAGSGGNGVRLTLKGSGTGPTQLQFDHPGWVGFTSAPGAPIQHNQSYHFAYVRSNSFSMLYLDGQLLLQTSVSYGSAVNQFYLGNRRTMDLIFNYGLLDEVRVSDEVLPPGQFLNVPEPGVATLLMGGLLLLGRCRRVHRS
jgi:hypothetical protein